MNRELRTKLSWREQWAPFLRGSEGRMREKETCDIYINRLG